MSSPALIATTLAAGSEMADSYFIIPYQRLYSTVFQGLRPLYYLLVVFWIIALFYAMYSIADRHFTWALEHLAKGLKLSPDLAGMTLLAFGNGAPDFFTALFGASEEPEMILGSSVGGGLFIITIVFGCVLLMAKKTKRKRSIVLADGSLKDVATDAGNNDNDNDNGEHGEDEGHAVLAVKDDVGLFKCTQLRHQLQPMSFLRSSGMYLLCIVVLGIFAFMSTIPWWLPVMLLVVYSGYMIASIAYYYGTRDKSSASIISEVIGKNFQADRTAARETFQQLSHSAKLWHALKVTMWEPRRNSFETFLQAIALTLKAPVNLIFNLTILPIEVPEETTTTDGEKFVCLRFLHRIRCILNPPFSLSLYLVLLGPSPSSIPYWIYGILLGISLIFSGLLWWGTLWDGPPKAFPLHICYSFCTSILWIYATSNELLSCLSTTGQFLGVSPTIVGILVLAWGNSFGDLVADVTIARNGSFETAVSAVFSGPVQNVLLTIGTAFLVAALRSPSHNLSLMGLRSDIYIALAFLLLTMILIMLIIPFKFDFRVSRTFGFLLLVVYFLYLPLGLLFGLGILRIPGKDISQ